MKLNDLGSQGEDDLDKQGRSLPWGAVAGGGLRCLAVEQTRTHSVQEFTAQEELGLLPSLLRRKAEARPRALGDKI